MKAHSANLLNSLTLIILGLWGFAFAYVPMTSSEKEICLARSKDKG